MRRGFFERSVFIPLPAGLSGLLLIALSIFPALAFGREAAVQSRYEHTILRLECDWLRALVERDSMQPLIESWPMTSWTQVGKEKWARKGKCWKG